MFRSVADRLLVDGVPVNSLTGISPAMVASIEVRKGASAAISSSKGYGWAVLIKLKTLDSSR